MLRLGVQQGQGARLKQSSDQAMSYGISFVCCMHPWALLVTHRGLHGRERGLRLAVAKLQTSQHRQQSHKITAWLIDLCRGLQVEARLPAPHRPEQ